MATLANTFLHEIQRVQHPEVVALLLQFLGVRHSEEEKKRKSHQEKRRVLKTKFPHTNEEDIADALDKAGGDIKRAEEELDRKQQVLYSRSRENAREGANRGEGYVTEGSVGED
jgi:transcriptional regulator with PAS, ATPase and Fis domain